jgi:hypothetical protein
MLRWGVGDGKDDRDYMSVLPEEKKSRLQQEDFDDHDLGKDGKYWKAIVFLSNMIGDPASLEIGEVPEEKLSEFSDMIRNDYYLKFNV